MNNVKFATLILGILALSSAGSTAVTPQEQIDAIRERVKQADEILAGLTGRRLYLVKSGRKFRQFTDPAELPESDDIFLVGSDDDRTIAIVHISTSESGDWETEYTHIFDRAGNTVAFRRESRFFNGDCSSATAEPLIEESIRFFGHDHELLRREYSLRDQKGHDIPPTDCTFAYHHGFTIYRTAREAAVAVGIARYLVWLK